MTNFNYFNYLNLNFTVNNIIRIIAKRFNYSPLYLYFVNYLVFKQFIPPIFLEISQDRLLLFTNKQ